MFTNRKKNNCHGGSTLTEVVIVAAILSVVSLAFLGTFAALSRFHEKDLLDIKGELLAEEGIEAIRLIKSAGFNTLSSLPVEVDSYLALSASMWGVTTTPEIIDGTFYRSFRTHAVSRDASDDIVSSGGTVDADTLLIDVTVHWNWRNSTSTAIYRAYMMNI